MNLLNGSPRQRIPATALVVCEERHDAIVSALRASATPLTDQPPLRGLARAIVGEQAIDFYRSMQTP